MILNPYFDLYESARNSFLPAKGRRSFETLALQLGLMHNALGLAIKDLIQIINQNNHQPQELVKTKEIVEIIEEEPQQIERILQTLSQCSEKSISMPQIIEVEKFAARIQIRNPEVVDVMSQIQSLKPFAFEEVIREDNSINFADYAYKKPPTPVPSQIPFPAPSHPQRRLPPSLLCLKCKKITDLGIDNVCFKCKKKDKESQI